MDSSPAHIQCVAIAAVLQGKTDSQFLKGVNQGNNNRGTSPASKGNCFSCGQAEHFSRACPQGPQGG